MSDRPALAKSASVAIVGHRRKCAQSLGKGSLAESGVSWHYIMDE